MKTFRIALTALVLLSACKGEEPFDTARVKGSELLKKNDFAAAAVEYERSLELKPDQDAKVWDRAAFANMKAGNLDRAAEILEKSLDRRVGTAAKSETLRNIALMYKEQANLEGSEKYFQKAIALDPKDDQAVGWYAWIAASRGGAFQQAAPAQTEHLKIALERYDAVIALEPTRSAGYVNKRIVLTKYIEHLNKQKAEILADADAQKADKEAFADLQEQAADTQARADELKALMDATSTKLGEVLKAEKAAKAGK